MLGNYEIEIKKKKVFEPLSISLTVKTRHSNDMHALERQNTNQTSGNHSSSLG